MNAIWIIDEHKLRREGTAGFLAKWAVSEEITLRQVERADHIFPAELSESDSENNELCLLGIGGDSLADEAVERQILELLDVLAGRPLVIISDNVDDREVKLANRFGVRGLIPTMLDAEVAVRAIGYVLSGGSYFPSRASVRKTEAPKSTGEAPSLAEVVARAGNAEAPELSERQHDVLRALQQGHSNKLIARELNLSEATVKIHVRTLLKKFGASNRTQVAIMAADPSLTPTKKTVTRRPGTDGQTKSI